MNPQLVKIGDAIVIDLDYIASISRNDVFGGPSSVVVEMTTGHRVMLVGNEALPAWTVLTKRWTSETPIEREKRMARARKESPDARTE